MIYCDHIYSDYVEETIEHCCVYKVNKVQIVPCAPVFTIFVFEPRYTFMNYTVEWKQRLHELADDIHVMICCSE